MVDGGYLSTVVIHEKLAVESERPMKNLPGRMLLQAELPLKGRFEDSVEFPLQRFLGRQFALSGGRTLARIGQVVASSENSNETW
jgi:hypothetical protein